MADAGTSNVGSRTALGAAWLIAWRMMTRVLGFVSTLVLARILVPADFGLVAMATTFTVALEAMSELGLLEALVRRADTDRHALDTAFTMQVIRGLAIAGITALGTPFFSDWFGEPRLQATLYILAALSAAAGFENIGIVEFRRSLRFDVEFKLQAAPRLCQFFVTIGAAWLLHSYWALMLGIATSKLARLAMTYTIHPYRPRLTLSHWRDLVGFSFWTWAASMAILVWERCDAFILGPKLGAAQLGVYLIAAELAVLPITELVAPTSRALFAGFSILQNQGTKLVEVALPVVATLLTVVLPLSIAVSATAGQIVIVLLDPKWYAAQPLISTFAWLCVFSPFSWVCTTVLVAGGAVRRNFVATAAAAFVKACVVYGASLTGQTEIVAMASVACVATESVLFVTQLRQLGDMHARENLGSFLRVLLAALVTVAILYLTGLGWHVTTTVRLLAFFHGALIGLGAIACCLLVQFALWWGAGRPKGPEQQLIAHLRRIRLPDSVLRRLVLVFPGIRFAALVRGGHSRDGG